MVQRGIGMTEYSWTWNRHSCKQATCGCSRIDKWTNITVFFYLLAVPGKLICSHWNYLVPPVQKWCFGQAVRIFRWCLWRAQRSRDCATARWHHTRPYRSSLYWAYTYRIAEFASGGLHFRCSEMLRVFRAAASWHIFSKTSRSYYGRDYVSEPRM